MANVSDRTATSPIVVIHRLGIHRLHRPPHARYSLYLQNNKGRKQCAAVHKLAPRSSLQFSD